MTPEELQRWMEAAGYFDPVELAKVIGTHRSTVERWLKGEASISPRKLYKLLHLQPKRVFARRFEEHKAQVEAARKAAGVIPEFEIVEVDLAPPVPGPADVPARPEAEPDFPLDAAPFQPAPVPRGDSGRGSPRPVWPIHPCVLVASLAGLGTLLLAVYVALSAVPSRDGALPPTTFAYDFRSAPEMIPFDETPADAGVGDSGAPAPASAPAKASHPVPDTPLEGQARAPCPAGPKTIRGGCWWLGVDDKGHPQRAPCPEALYEFEGFCYGPMSAQGKPLPNTTPPKNTGR